MANVTKQKPMTNDWSYSFCGCLGDTNSCCRICWCPCCYCSDVSKEFGESSCFNTRTAVRIRFGIKGSACNDVCVSCCCCTWCQIANEIKHQKKKKVDTKSSAVIMQPTMAVPQFVQPVMAMPQVMQPAIAMQPAMAMPQVMPGVIIR